MRRGTRELGLKTTWRYRFVGHGSVLSAAPEAVIVDVGNHLGPGVIDQHQDASLGRSSSELILKHPELVYDHLVGPWLDAERSGADLSGRSWSPWIVTHRSPDFDGVVAAFLTQRLVEDGTLPVGTEALVGYSTQVDTGRYRVDPTSPETWREAVNLAQLVLTASEHPDEEVLTTGIALITELLESVTEARGGVPPPRCSP